MTDAENAKAIREAMRPGGKPIAMMTQTHQIMGSAIALKLTNEILRNLEERICALEEKLQ